MSSKSQRAVHKRKAETDVAADQQSSRKQSSADHGKRRKAGKTSATSSEEALFKIRHATEFDDESASDKSDNRIQVKQEPEDDCSVAVTPRRVTRSSARAATETPSNTRIKSAAVTPRKLSKTTSSRDDTDQDDIFVAILSQSSWDLKMTESAVENLSQRARQTATNGQLFDMAYVDSIITRLDRTGIEPVRRSQVVGLLQEFLRHSLSDWDSCIDQVGSRIQITSALPDPSLATNRPSESRAVPTPKPGSSQMLYVDVSPVKRGAFDSQEPQENDDSSNSTSDSDSQDSENCSESDYHEHKRKSSTKAPTVRTPLANPGSSTTVDYDKITTNVRLYGTRYPKSAFDMLARCIIFAWAAAPHPGDTPTNTREYTLLRWRKVSGEQKCAWQKLFEERGDPSIDVFQKSLQLLLSQDLLKVFVPENRLNAALLHCQRHQTQHMLAPRDRKPVKQAASPTSFYSVRRDDRRATVDIKPFTGNFARRELNSKIGDNFPRFVQAMSDTPTGQACLIPSNARHAHHNTCIFILNSPDVRSESNLTESDVRVACQEANLRGFTSIERQTHNVFVAFFSHNDDATQARQRARIKFEAFPGMTGKGSSSLRLKVKAEPHCLHVNRVFVFETSIDSVNHATVVRRVFDALDGPLAPVFHLFTLDLNPYGPRRRIRYLLRPSEAVPPIYVERFYIPLDAANGKGHVWGIFKPHPKHYKCPGCHERCQSGKFNTCPVAVELQRPDDAKYQVGAGSIFLTFRAIKYKHTDVTCKSTLV